MINLQDVYIRPVRKEENYLEITSLIRSAYKSLLDKGFRYWGTYQTVEDTKRRYSDGKGFIAELDGRVIGTITLKDTYDGWEETKWYDKSDVCYFTQFAVLPEYQKSGLGSFMMNFFEEKAKELGFKEISLDTCEDAVDLINYYKKRNYRLFAIY